MVKYIFLIRNFKLRHKSVCCRWPAALLKNARGEFFSTAPAPLSPTLCLRSRNIFAEYDHAHARTYQPDRQPARRRRRAPKDRRPSQEQQWSVVLYPSPAASIKIIYSMMLLLLPPSQMRRDLFLQARLHSRASVGFKEIYLPCTRTTVALQSVTQGNNHLGLTLERRLAGPLASQVSLKLDPANATQQTWLVWDK